MNDPRHHPIFCRYCDLGVEACAGDNQWMHSASRSERCCTSTACRAVRHRGGCQGPPATPQQPADMTAGIAQAARQRRSA